MQELKILNKSEKQELVNKLRKQFGIQEVPGIILRKGEEKLFLFQGNLNPKEIKNLEQTIPIERIGVYFAKIIRGEIRLSIEGAQLFQEQINKNIFELNDQQMQEWMKGRELNIQMPEDKRNFLVMKYKEHFLGTGKASAEKISNYIPKSRRLKEKN